MTVPGQDRPEPARPGEAYQYAGASGGQQAPPTCYRHPDRETWVSCSRCGKPACPDCRREAAVGQQCLECVPGAGAGPRQPRSAFGGRLVSGAALTWTLVGINVVLFLVEL